MESNIIVVNLFIADIFICLLRIYKNYYKLPKIILGYPFGRDFMATMTSSELEPTNGSVILENNNGRWRKYSSGHYCFRRPPQIGYDFVRTFPNKGSGRVFTVLEQVFSF
jgi:hypothetical protein